jgi:hypothetical protein
VKVPTQCPLVLLAVEFEEKIRRSEVEVKQKII